MKTMAMMTLLCAFLLTGPAYGADTLMHIKVTLVQCGEMGNIESACLADQRCCAFLEPASGGDEGENVSAQQPTGSKSYNMIPIRAAMPSVGILQQTYVTE